MIEYPSHREPSIFDRELHQSEPNLQRPITDQEAMRKGREYSYERSVRIVLFSLSLSLSPLSLGVLLES